MKSSTVKKKRQQMLLLAQRLNAEICRLNDAPCFLMPKIKKAISAAEYEAQTQEVFNAVFKDLQLKIGADDLLATYFQAQDALGKAEENYTAFMQKLDKTLQLTPDMPMLKEAETVELSREKAARCAMAARKKLKSLQLTGTDIVVYFFRQGGGEVDALTLTQKESMIRMARNYNEELYNDIPQKYRGEVKMQLEKDFIITNRMELVRTFSTMFLNKDNSCDIKEIRLDEKQVAAVKKNNSSRATDTAKDSTQDIQNKLNDISLQTTSQKPFLRLSLNYRAEAVEYLQKHKSIVNHKAKWLLDTIFWLCQNNCLKVQQMTKTAYFDEIPKDILKEILALNSDAYFIPIRLLYNIYHVQFCKAGDRHLDDMADFTAWVEALTNISLDFSLIREIGHRESVVFKMPQPDLLTAKLWQKEKNKDGESEYVAAALLVYLLPPIQKFCYDAGYYSKIPVNVLCDIRNGLDPKSGREMDNMVNFIPVLLEFKQMALKLGRVINITEDNELPSEVKEQTRVKRAKKYGKAKNIDIAIKMELNLFDWERKYKDGRVEKQDGIFRILDKDNIPFDGVPKSTQTKGYQAYRRLMAKNGTIEKILEQLNISVFLYSKLNTEKGIITVWQLPEDDYQFTGRQLGQLNKIITLAENTIEEAEEDEY